MQLASAKAIRRKQHDKYKENIATNARAKYAGQCLGETYQGDISTVSQWKAARQRQHDKSSTTKTASGQRKQHDEHGESGRTSTGESSTTKAT
jgi:hypothetical protein